ncbi:MAG: YihA family ribosome biogenesis GTP-binding protein [Spirochaetes bacterium]|nr:YihA family ribosome biogenesis GTP-binding protein [Spirochaetota bacterium]
MKIKKSEFYKSFIDYKKIPEHNKIELAFVGRSNVGKSSLINDVCGRKIAMTSSTPGKTQLINFFFINNSFYFVDLPGYGYSKSSKDVRKKWPKMIEDYLVYRKQLKTIIFLLDIRRIPNEHDIFLKEWFEKIEGLKVIYILTKSDKLSKSDINNQIKKISAHLNINLSDMICYSVPKKTGKAEFLKKLEKIIST